MSNEHDLDALLRSTLREEAEPTGYAGGLDAPVFRGVRRRRQRRVAAAAVGGASALALVVGALTLTQGASSQPITPAGQSTQALPPTVSVSTATLTTTTTVYPTETSDSATSTDGQSGTTSTTSGESSSGDPATATDWSNLPTGKPVTPLVAYTSDGERTTLVWDGKTINVDLVSSEMPRLRTVQDSKGTPYLVIKAHEPGSTPPEGTDDVYLVARDGTTRKVFSAVPGGVAQSPSGAPRLVAVDATKQELQVRSLDTLDVVSSGVGKSDTPPMTWGSAGIALRGGDVVDPSGAPQQFVSGVRTATTSGTGVTYAVTDTEVLRVTSSGTTRVGGVRPGQGSAFAGASPHDDYVATVGGVMSTSTGEYVIEASGTITAIQWVDATHVVFVRSEDNVRCDVEARTCERADRGGTSPHNLLGW